MFKQLLASTVPHYKVSAAEIAAVARMPLSEVEEALEGAAEVSAETYEKIMQALPKCFLSTVKTEMEYVDAQLAMLEEQAADVHLPMFQGIRRLIKKF